MTEVAEVNVINIYKKMTHEKTKFMKKINRSLSEHFCPIDTVTGQLNGKKL